MGTNEMFALPDRTVTADPGVAAEQWAKAFHDARDALEEVRDALSACLQGKPNRCLDEILERTEKILSMGEW